MTDLSVPAVPIMSKTKARKLIDHIKVTADGLWTLLLEAHDGGAWKALGYKSWAECAEVEFGKSRSRSYQILSHARLMGELTEASEVSTKVDRITDHDARDLGAEGRAELVAEHAAATTPEEADEAVERGLARAAAERAAKAKPTASTESGRVTTDLTSAALSRLVDMAVAAGTTREAMASRILNGVLETGEVAAP